MKFFEFRKKRKSLNENVQSDHAADMYMQPFKEMPSSSAGQKSADRINEHDLFSLYTADIINEKTIFVR